MASLRTTFVAAAAFSAIVVGPAALAAFTPEEQVDAAKLAVIDFKTDHADHYQHFVGAKFWKSTDDVKVKIYVDHDGMAMEYNYLCHKHDGDTECHAQ